MADNVRAQFGEGQWTVLHESGAEGTTGTGTVIDTLGAKYLILYLDVTAVSGTSPTLDLLMQQSVDQNDWSTYMMTDAWTQNTAASTQLNHSVIATRFARFIRPKFTIGGSATPTVTFTLTGNFT